MAVGPFGDIDGGPSKDVVIGRRDDPKIARFFAPRLRQAAGGGAVRPVEKDPTS